MARNYAALPHEYLEEMEALNDAEFGRLTRALLAYSMTGEPMALCGNERFYAKRVMAQEDRFRDSYDTITEKRSRAGKAGAGKRWQTHGKHGNTETDTDTKTETETNALPSDDGRSRGARAPSAPRGQYGWVKLTEEEYSHLVAELGQGEAQRCIDYVDQSAQGTNNKNRWVDWNLVVRRCHREGWGLKGGTPPAAGPAVDMVRQTEEDMTRMRRMLAYGEEVV